MNPISKVLGPWEHRGKTATARIPLHIWAKVIIYGGYFFLLLLMAEMEFRPIVGWPKRAYYQYEESRAKMAFFRPA